MKKIMLIHGPNLNQLGQRDPAHEGKKAAGYQEAVHQLLNVSHEKKIPDIKVSTSSSVFNLVIGNPLEHTQSPLLHNTISGIEMFIGQGIRQIELWTENPLLNEKLVNQLRTLLMPPEENRS